MKLTILETGRAPGALADVYPRYPDMMASLLARADAALAFETVSLIEGEPLPAAGELDAAAIMGSPFGVYDPTAWMDPLRAFVREAHAAKTPLLGVCFGHQIIADALGGDVGRSDKGWGVGRHVYRILARAPWMGEAPDTLALVASHQDQVRRPPAGADTLAASEHTPHALLAYRDAPILTIQGHPEFSDAFAAALYGARRGAGLSDETADAAIQSLSAPEDNQLAAEWMATFLRENVR